ncbi:MAG TPA: DUF167 domain-containing protein, partial [Nitrospirales bacterium]|nr:DUF167 domain-containing protein [Nitrospirales bacterium]
MMSPATGKRAVEPQVTLSLRVLPRASRNAVVGWTGANLKIRLTAPPVEGAANAACVKFLADLLDVPPSNLTILKGDRSRQKVVRITGLKQDEVRARLSPKVA